MEMISVTRQSEKLKITPREFQSRGILRLREKIAEGKKRIILMAPTGAGKGLIMAMLTDMGLAKGSDVLTILYGQDLIMQTYENYKRYFQIESNIIMGKIKSFPSKSSIASISTLSRRVLPPANFLIIDECHQSKAPQYAPIFNHYVEKIIIGLSATPINNLDNFEDYIVLATVQELIDLGYLVKPRHFRPKRIIDVSKVSISKGEYDNSQLETEAMKITGDIVKEFIDRASNRIAVAFCVNVKHSKELAMAFCLAGVSAVHVDATTPLEERTAILRDLKDGVIQMITNVNVFSTGVDCPEIGCVLMVRPTKSEILYVQQGGRGLRPSLNKDDCIIIDYSDNVSRFGLLTDDREPNILPKGAKKKLKDEAEIKIWVCLKCYCCNYDKDLVCADCATPRPVVIKQVKIEKGELEEVTESPSKREKKPVGNMITFGKYKGKTYSELPMGYISWAIQNLKDKQFLINIKAELERRINKHQ